MAVPTCNRAALLRTCLENVLAQWLAHYHELQAHLRSTYSCVLANDRVVIFDLTRRRDGGTEGW